MARKERDVEEIDPNRIPSTMDQRQIRYFKHPDAKNKALKYDAFSLTLNVAGPGETPAVLNDKPIRTFQGKWTGDPDKTILIEEKFLKRPQPFVGTCSRPVPGENMGCFAHNGCPYPDAEDPRGRGPGPFNVIIEKDGQKSPCPCFHAYHGTRRGLPTSQVHYLYSGFRIDTDGTSVPGVRAKMVTDEWGGKAYADEEIENEVDNLGPMYAHHFGKKKQKPKAELPMEGRADEVGNPMDASETTFVNTSPGSLRGAPAAKAPQSVKIR